MNIGVVIWLVFCIGVSLMASSGPKKGEYRSTKAMQCFGIGAVIWSSGLAVWWLAGVVAAALG